MGGWEPVSFSLGRTQQHPWQIRQKVTLATGSYLAQGFTCLFTALPCVHPHPIHPSKERLAEGEGGGGGPEPADSPINLNLHAWHISVP